jgi:hypothetical protein
MQDERRKNDRRRFAYYMPFIDNCTHQCLGYLVCFLIVSVLGFLGSATTYGM